MLCRSQVLLTGMGEVIDLNLVAVKTIMDLYKIKDQQMVFEKIYKVFHFMKQKKGDNGE